MLAFFFLLVSDRLASGLLNMTNVVPGPRNTKTIYRQTCGGNRLGRFPKQCFLGAVYPNMIPRACRGTTTKRAIMHATHILSWVRFGYPYQIHKGSPRTDSSDFVRLRQTSSDFVRGCQRTSLVLLMLVLLLGPHNVSPSTSKHLVGADIRDV